MGALIDIIQFSFSSIVWGILIAVVCMALFVFIIKGWWRNALFTVWSYLIGIVLFLLLTFQCTLIAGSIKIINTTEEYEEYFTEIVNSAYEGWEEVSIEDADVVIKKAIAEYPLLSYYIGGGQFSGYNAKRLPKAIADELVAVMSAYIGRRLLWCLAFVVIAGFIGIKTINKNNRSARADRTERISARSSRPAAGRERRPHISHRRR